MIRASIAGASGYAGGELLRLLLDHPEVEVQQVQSERFAGEPVGLRHPNLRGRTALRFVALRELEPCDVLFAALPHGESARRIDELSALAPRLVDLSSDFRLRDARRYARWYGREHGRPEWLARFVYGLPELHRDELRGAALASGVGCNATATILALLPLSRAGLLDAERDVVCDLKVGSSEGGAEPSAASHHPERARAARSYAPTGHRHTAEVEQALETLGSPVRVHLSVTAIELVRGVLATAHAFVKAGVGARDVWSAYREACAGEPFLRLVNERRGLYRCPEPKHLAGCNVAELGFDLDAGSGRVVALCAIDNLMKGAAGSAIQCLNLMLGFDERAGLGFPGLHPI
jgi:N-acetyl-gamma-glutamyl-phosphate/LysW-gamma-L-alpha-aminoadipyl-6-phosphate reductase